LLGRSIFLPSRRRAMDDCHADQADNTHANPLQRHVEQVGTNRQTGDEYDVSTDVYPKRHSGHLKRSQMTSRCARSVR